MPTLVTGGCGFIGQHLVNSLLATGEEVRVLDDFSSGHPSNLRPHPKLTIVEGCVTDLEAVREAARDAVRIFHLAAVVGQIQVNRRPDWAATVSRQSLINLNAAAPDAPLVLFSSSAVYGLTSEGLCSEEDVTGEDAAVAYDGGYRGYAYGKWVSERLAEERRPGTWLTVRPFNVIGPGQVGTYGMVVPRFVRAALEGSPLTIYGTGRQTRSFGDVRAFVSHLLKLEQAWTAGDAAHSVYNIGTTRETSIEALADTVGVALGRTIDKRYVPFETVFPGKADVDRRRPDLARIDALLGLLEWPPLEDSIRAVADIFTPEAGAPPRFAAAGAAAD